MFLVDRVFPKTPLVPLMHATDDCHKNHYHSHAIDKTKTIVISVFSKCMATKRLSEALRWQIYVMHATGMSVKTSRKKLCYSHCVTAYLSEINNETIDVKDWHRRGPLLKRIPWKDRTPTPLIWLKPFASREERLCATELPTTVSNQWVWSSEWSPNVRVRPNH